MAAGARRLSLLRSRTLEPLGLRSLSQDALAVNVEEALGRFWRMVARGFAAAINAPFDNPYTSLTVFVALVLLLLMAVIILSAR